MQFLKNSISHTSECLWLLWRLWKTFFPRSSLLFYTFTQPLWNDLNKAVILYNGPSNLNWQLPPRCCLKYGSTCHFYSAESGWQLRGTTTDCGYMRGSLSDDSMGRMESRDVMETRPLTDTTKETSLSAPVHNHSYPRSMSESTTG